MLRRNCWAFGSNPFRKSAWRLLTSFQNEICDFFLIYFLQNRETLCIHERDFHERPTNNQSTPRQPNALRSASYHHYLIRLSKIKELVIQNLVTVIVIIVAQISNDIQWNLVTKVIHNLVIIISIIGCTNIKRYFSFASISQCLAWYSCKQQ